MPTLQRDGFGEIEAAKHRLSVVKKWSSSAAKHHREASERVMSASTSLATARKEETEAARETADAERELKDAADYLKSVERKYGVVGIDGEATTKQELSTTATVAAMKKPSSGVKRARTISPIPNGTLNLNQPAAKSTKLTKQRHGILLKDVKSITVESCGVRSANGIYTKGLGFQNGAPILYRSDPIGQYYLYWGRSGFWHIAFRQMNVLPPYKEAHLYYAEGTVNEMATSFWRVNADGVSPPPKVFLRV